MPDATPRPAIDPSAAELLALFAGQLSGVRFPEVDHETLDELAASVERSHAEVEQARALLATAEATLEARRQELLSRAQRAKAYARVYAEGNPELQAQLDGIVLPKPGGRVLASPPSPGQPEPKKRGRPRKVDVEARLFGEAHPSEVPAAE